MSLLLTLHHSLGWCAKEVHLACSPKGICKGKSAGNLSSKEEQRKALTVARDVEGMETDRISVNRFELPLVALCTRDCLLSCVCMGTCTWVSLFCRGFLEPV